ncbi:MAG: hypothetical protein AVDCRST_MAG49-4176, partial [uncultured Thermomicrobiales bacterium]
VPPRHPPLDVLPVRSRRHGPRPGAARRPRPTPPQPVWPVGRRDGRV